MRPAHHKTERWDQGLDSGQRDEAALFAERGRIAKLERVRQLVFGSLDGLLVPLGVVSGVAAGTGSSKAVIVAGIEEAFAGALSMGAGEFISGRSEGQVQLRQIRKELEEIRDDPAFELKEMAALLQAEGIAVADSLLIAQTLACYPHAYAKTMVEKELGVPFDPKIAQVPEALTMGASYLLAAVVPLIAYFHLPVYTAFGVSLGLTFFALVVVGFVKRRLTRIRLVRSIAEVVIEGRYPASAATSWVTSYPVCSAIRALTTNSSPCCRR